MENIKSIVRGCYDLQKLRIQTGLRIVASYKKKLGQGPGEKETKLDKKAKELLLSLRKSYRRLTDGMVVKKDNFKGDGLIDNITEFILIEQYINLLKAEISQFRWLGKIMEDVPIYVQYLKHIKGIGPAIAGVIVSEFDIFKAKYPSSFCMYAGLDVVIDEETGDGEGRSKKKHHLIDVEYINKKGEIETRKSITFNPFLKTKLIGVLGPSFLKCKNETYGPIYYNYKNRLENHVDHHGKSKGHKHNMSIRYMVKRFIIDFHPVWRALEGLPVSEEYAIAKLGYKHKAS